MSVSPGVKSSELLLQWNMLMALWDALGIRQSYHLQLGRLCRVQAQRVPFTVAAAKAWDMSPILCNGLSVIVNER